MSRINFAFYYGEGTSRRKCYIIIIIYVCTETSELKVTCEKGLSICSSQLQQPSSHSLRTRGHRRSTNAMNDRIFATAFPFCLLYGVKFLWFHIIRLKYYTFLVFTDSLWHSGCTNRQSRMRVHTKLIIMIM
jgi:hypothetical protein